VGATTKGSLTLLLQTVGGCAHFRQVSLQTLDVIIGKCARVACVVPSAKPFVAGLWGGLAAVNRLNHLGQREASPGHAATRRFCYSAAWIRALLSEDESCPLDLERLVFPKPPPRASVSGWRVEYDASIYGGGAVLRRPDGVVDQHFFVLWDGTEAEHLGVWIGDSKFQTFWEYAVFLLVLVQWADMFHPFAMPILGDNTGALQAGLELKGRGVLLAIAREISWRKARRRWTFQVGHLPSEHNTVSDALSRVADPSSPPWPASCLASSTWVTPARLRDLWRALPS